MTIWSSIRSGLVPVHREGWRFIAIFAVGAILLELLHLWPLALLGVLLTAWCAYFFRDPSRVTPLGQNLVIAPADGRISAIESVIPPPELDLPREKTLRISIFMNVFDVHINRAPASGRITRLAYVPGAFINAELDKASEDNERQALTVETTQGTVIGVVQIAGFIARRIVRFVSEGDSLQAGQRFGLIRFGSRVDVYLPEGTVPFVGVGQRAIGGETVLAELSGTRPAYGFRQG